MFWKWMLDMGDIFLDRVFFFFGEIYDIVCRIILFYFFFLLFVLGVISSN